MNENHYEVCSECRDNCSSDCGCWCHGHTQTPTPSKKPIPDQATIDQLRLILKLSKELTERAWSAGHCDFAVLIRTVHESTKEAMAELRND